MEVELDVHAELTPWLIKMELLHLLTQQWYRSMCLQTVGAKSMTYIWHYKQSQECNVTTKAHYIVSHLLHYAMPSSASTSEAYIIIPSLFAFGNGAMSVQKYVYDISFSTCMNGRIQTLTGLHQGHQDNT